MRLLSCLLLLCPLLLLAADDLERRKAELQALQQDIQRISAQLERDQNQSDKLSREILRSEQRLSNLRQALALLAADLTAARQRSQTLTQEQQALQDQLKAEFQALAAQLRSAYIIGRQADSRMLFSQDDPARLARLQHYLARFQARHQRRIDGVERTLRALQDKREAARQALTELEQLRLSREQALAGLEQQKAARGALLAQVQERLRSGASNMAQRKAEQARLEALVESLSQAVQRQAFVAPRGRFGDNRGRLVRPAGGEILARYNHLKSDGESRWKGLWIAAEEGSGVRAVADARVVYVGWMHRLGLLLVLDHGDGYFSLYGHNRAALKNVGDRVSAGEVIAEAGDTGGHDRSGVYLEIRQGRKALDPAPWLASRG